MKNLKLFPIPMFIILFSVLLSVGIFTFNQQEQVNNCKNEYKIITEKLNSVFGWAINKDFEKFFNTIANDSDFRSITPYKKVKFGVEDIKNDTSFWASPRFKAIGHDITDLKIQLSKSGKVAWFYCIVNDYNEWNGQPVSWENVRWTGVLEKRNNEWRIAQQHFSFASSD